MSLTTWATIVCLVVWAAAILKILYDHNKQTRDLPPLPWGKTPWPLVVVGICLAAYALWQHGSLLHG